MKETKREEKSGTEERIEEIKHAIEEHMRRTVAHDIGKSSQLDRYSALAHALKDKIVENWLKTQREYYRKNPKRVYYFSMEYLMGRTLDNAMINLEMSDTVEAALERLGFSRRELEEVEWDAGLGNGGLGRLAACFLDSMATMELPAYGFGIRYEFGMFRQYIDDHQQCERPDNWLRYGNPWEYPRAEEIQLVHFYGRTNSYRGQNGNLRNEWIDTDTVVAMPYDMPIPGYKTASTISLKLWSSKSSREFNLETFNAGDYIGAIVDKHQSEVISKVLYPNDNNYKGKELRLKQQYFMVSASLQDILSRLNRSGDKVPQLPEKVCIQLNDTHPSVAIPELMRILLDIYLMGWEEAWSITTRTFAYTNHTVLPEALEKWPVDLFQKVLPRHMEIIYEINHRLLDTVNTKFPGDFERQVKLSIIEEGEVRQVRMANLAIVGSFSVNGVAKIHSDLLKTDIFKEFYELYPRKFNNKTNGITPRRWLKKSNSALSELICDHIGEGWIKDLNQLRMLEPLTNDEKFLSDWKAVKRANKRILGETIRSECGVEVDVDSMFDVQVKRIHEYKRQLLNVLHIVTLYDRLKSGRVENMSPRTVVFAGKAAPGYFRAKEIIHLINQIGSLINRDKSVGNMLKVVFLPNYGVSLAERIFPGSDLSEQISTAGMEASGTGNMKFALNGALTIGTLDGANVEMMEEVGRENIFIFGNREPEIRALREGGYNPQDYYRKDEELRIVLNRIRDGHFSPNCRERFRPIFDSLVHGGDYYFHLADYRSYIDCQEQVSLAYRDSDRWTKMAILNVARMGKFSSDRTIGQYADEIWGIEPCRVVAN